ncbi:hypothetical protein [Levilactobacillus bambusae]|uniref:Uncharacterized protein n=1 Tax=Levilactobacillus bambusae TaxID=2024736 RepID=A0A2V1N1F6_9LACO|nr:hypothetical protein [Levilactobacillus bambusae]PWG01077.1 hypothetical protein DCM90_02575 [Levilactobacillus bambusae]
MNQEAVLPFQQLYQATTESLLMAPLSDKEAGDILTQLDHLPDQDDSLAKIYRILIMDELDFRRRQFVFVGNINHDGTFLDYPLDMAHWTKLSPTDQQGYLDTGMMFDAHPVSLSEAQRLIE